MQWNVHFACVDCYIFANWSQTPASTSNLSTSSESQRRFQRCVVRTEMLSNFHARVEYIAVTKYVIETIGPKGANDPQNPPFPSRHADLHLIHECLDDPTHHPKRHLDLFRRFATVHFPDRHTDRPTDRQTPAHIPTRWARRQVRNISAPLAMLIESDALIRLFSWKLLNVKG